MGLNSIPPGKESERGLTQGNNLPTGRGELVNHPFHTRCFDGGGNAAETGFARDDDAAMDKSMPSQNFGDKFGSLQRKNEPQRKLLLAKRRTFPFDDQSPLAQAGVPRNGTNLARGVLGDDETGLPSDIVPVLFGG